MSTNTDLELIPDDELIEELNRRHETAMFLGMKHGCKGPPEQGQLCCATFGARLAILGLARAFVLAAEYRLALDMDQIIEG